MNGSTLIYNLKSVQESVRARVTGIDNLIAVMFHCATDDKMEVG